jgi:hypothetical protein
MHQMLSQWGGYPNGAMVGWLHRAMVPTRMRWACHGGSFVTMAGMATMVRYHMATVTRYHGHCHQCHGADGNDGECANGTTIDAIGRCQRSQIGKPRAIEAMTMARAMATMAPPRFLLCMQATARHQAV